MSTFRGASVEQPLFKCKYCGRHFQRESSYLAHKCKEMKRDEELRTPQGQAALNYYQLWMRTLRRNPPNAAAFLTSRYFRTFINFVQFAKNVGLPKPEKFIWLMVQRDYPPTIWTTDEAYTEYIEFLDRKTSPIEQALLSVETLISVANKHNVDTSEVFSVLTVQDIIQLLRTRRLSAWLLLRSNKFKHVYANDTNTEQRLIIENLIRPEYWGDKILEHQKDVEQIDALVRELGI